MTASDQSRSGEIAASGGANGKLPAAGIFNDGKAHDALRTIGEITKALGIRQHVLRYWEEQFPALQPIKRSGNRRYYRPEDVALIVQIDRLVNREGYTLRGARMALESGEPDLSVAVAQPDSSSPDSSPVEALSNHVFEELRRIRDRLARALAAA
ncbi:MAG: MerR family transcriptional regulator [Novosphingobium pentaromativorans]|uniref:MerR family transcriptional regulator n=1 Tax=Novosphingobium pentaromativorans TaxID=205844 RepID=A0A2W5QUB6_9SPHN|nr:MerR family transcriptional regulator [Novosphingobium panipatense]PZQ55050.1 MAG: MerR family transcriptional regulator [Novosphingobium pentaromativorans]